MGCSGSKSDSTYEAAKEPAKEVPTPAAAKPPPEQGSSDPAAAAAAAGEGSAALSKAKLEKVEALFEAWDFASEGKLEIKAFADVSVQNGPHKTMLLRSIADMDADGDGFVTREEWLTYFTMIAGSVADADFAGVIEEMETAGEPIVTILQCMRYATPAAGAGDAAEDDAPPPLSEARRELVLRLFSTWDVEGAGSIDRAKMQAHGVKLGPHDSSLYSNLEKMDLDADGSVTQSEMLSYFQTVTRYLSEDEFAEVLGDMQTYADENRLILELVSLGNAGAAAGAAVVEAAPLSEARDSKLCELYLLFSETTEQPIKVSDLKTATFRNGPHEDNLMQTLVSMDLDGDGDLTIAEMRSHFSQLGAGLSEDEFSLILDELITAARAAKLAKDFA